MSVMKLPHYAVTETVKICQERICASVIQDLDSLNQVAVRISMSAKKMK